MQQLLLDFDLKTEPTLDTYVVGKNAEVMFVLKAIVARQSRERFIYLWGEPAAGKTHLLQAIAQEKNTRYISPASPLEDFLFDTDITIYLLDDCQSLSDAQQIAAFNLFNDIRASANAYMVAAGNSVPQGLHLRLDLKSRLAWGLIYRLKTLSDEDKAIALSEYAKQQGFSLPPNIINYLMTHYKRDMHSLSTIMCALERYALETKRAITIPLLHDLLEKQLHED